MVAGSQQGVRGEAEALDDRFLGPDAGQNDEFVLPLATRQPFDELDRVLADARLTVVDESGIDANAHGSHLRRGAREATLA